MISKKQLEEKLAKLKRELKDVLHDNDIAEFDRLSKEIDDVKFEIAYYKEDAA
jgi:hypothetical protein